MTTLKIPPRNEKAIKALFEDLKPALGSSLSRTLVERISTSGDSTGTPFYHFRWKLHNLTDFVAYPETEEQVKQILLLANKYKVDVTPRGSGSDYYGSGIPTNGGVVVDMKRMKSFRINKEEMTVTAQPGLVFSNLMAELALQGLELGCYPTSAYTTTIGGWIGTGGTMGVGTLQNGTFMDQIVSLKLITPTGEEKIITNMKESAYLFGTSGIFGIVVEVTIKLLSVPKNEIALNFGFNNRDELLQCVEELVKSTDPFLIRFADVGHEFRSTGFSKYRFFLFLFLKERGSPIDELTKDCTAIIEKHHGTYIGDLYSKQVWEDYLKHEMRIKLNNPVLMLQQIYTDLGRVPPLIDLFELLIKKAKLNHAYYGIISKDMKVRLVFYTPTDNCNWLHFISSKATLHKVVKFAYHNGGRVYTYGLQDTLYLHHFEQQKEKELEAKKKSEDPNYILNQLKLVKTKMSFLRIDVMFELAYFYRLLMIWIGKADIILTPDIPEPYGDDKLE